MNYEIQVDIHFYNVKHLEKIGKIYKKLVQTKVKTNGNETRKKLC